MAHYHGVEWYHDPLSLLAATRGEKVALWTGFCYPSPNRSNPGDAGTTDWAHWDCVMSDPHARATWLGDGVAFEKPNLPINGMRNDYDCCICRRA